MLTPSALNLGLGYLTRPQLAMLNSHFLLPRRRSMGSAIQFTKWHQMGPERNIFNSFLV